MRKPHKIVLTTEPEFRTFRVPLGTALMGVNAIYTLYDQPPFNAALARAPMEERVRFDRNSIPRRFIPYVPPRPPVLTNSQGQYRDTYGVVIIGNVPDNTHIIGYQTVISDTYTIGRNKVTFRKTSITVITTSPL